MTATASSLSSLILLDTDLNVILNPDGTPVTGRWENGHLIFDFQQENVPVVVGTIQIKSKIVVSG